MTCTASFKSIVCPGPKLPKGVTASTPEDLRCRSCKFQAGDLRMFTDQNGDFRIDINDQHRIDSVSMAMRQARGWLMGTQMIPLGKKWADFVDATLIDIFYDVAGFALPCNFALIAVGSLARQEATPLSDLEFFIIVEKPGCHRQFMEIAIGMYNKIRPITQATKAFSEDAYFKPGMPYIAMDTRCYSKENQHPKTQLSKVEVDDDVLRTNLLGGRCLLGMPALYEQLKQAIGKNFSERTFVVMKFSNDLFSMSDRYGSVLKQWKARERNTVNVKQHILRPCTWIITYLSRYHGIEGPGGRMQLEALHRAGKLSNEVYRLIGETMSLGEEIRWKLHVGNKAEIDKIVLTTHGQQSTHVNRCLDNVSMLLAISEAWIKRKIASRLFRKISEKPFLTRNPLKYRCLEFDRFR